MSIQCLACLLQTSVIKSLANMTGRHIISVSLENIKTKRQLKQLFQDEAVHVVPANEQGQTEIFRIPVGKRLFVLEDVDAASQLVLDRQFQKPQQPKPKQDPSDKEEAGWQQAYDLEANEEDSDEEQEDALNLATLLNVLDGSKLQSVLLAHDTLEADRAVTIQL